jgi:LCP family protein required for cell wall assembly
MTANTGSGARPPLHSSVVPVSTVPPPPTIYTRADIHKKKKRRVRRLKRLAITITTTLVVLLAAVVGYVEYRNHQISRVVVNGLAAVPPSGVENVVMVGSTSRCALKQQNPAFGLCSQGVTGVNSDVVMILHLNPNRTTASILSIPRDLFVPNARTTGANKIDAALVQGPGQLVQAIEEDFGIPIQHYVELNFDSFQGVVNALGGIKMYFPMPLYDAESSLDIPTAGCHLLNGFQALAVVRARHLQYKAPGVTTADPRNWPQDPQSDLSRIRRDHEFLRVLASAVSARGLDNPVTDNDLLGSVAPQLQVDTGFSLGDMLGLVLKFHGVSPTRSLQETMPVVVDADNYYLGGYDYGSVELTSQPQDLQVVDGFLGVSANQDTMTGQPLPSPHSVTVSVLNGTGVSGQAAATGSALSALGLDVVGTGDAGSSGAVTETTIMYSPGHLAAAERVAHDLSGDVVMGVGAPSNGAEVTVITGSNFSVATPAPASTGASAPGSPPSTGPTPSAPPAASTVLAAPSKPTQSLAPFDPRSCTPSGGEGP